MDCVGIKISDMALPKSLDKNCPSWRYANKFCQNRKPLLSTRSQHEEFLTLVKPWKTCSILSYPLDVGCIMDFDTVFPFQVGGI